MESRLPKTVQVMPHNVFIAVIRFLEDYNEHLQDENINCLISEMMNCDIAQCVWIQWEKAFESVLKETGELENSKLLLLSKTTTNENK